MASRTTVQKVVTSPSEQIQPRLLTASIAARYLSIGEFALRHLDWSGQLPALRIGRRKLWDIRALNSFIDKRQAKEEAQ